MWSLLVISFLISQWINRPINQSINKSMKEILTKNKNAKLPTITHFALSLLILASWIFTISEEYDPEDISKIPGIPFVEILRFKMSASDGLDHTLTSPVISWTICPTNMMLTSISCFKTGRMQLIQWNYNWDEERVMINQLNLQRFPTAAGYRPWLDTHTTPPEKVP